jgi:hypothetical protein
MPASIVNPSGKLYTSANKLSIFGAQWAIPTQGLTWSTAPNISWAWATTSSTTLATITNPISNATQQAQITTAINLWSAVSGVKLTRVATPAAAQIQIGWADCGALGLIGESLWAFSGSTFTAGLVILEDPALSALTTAGDGQLIYASANVELGQLACHEFGATLGLGEGNVDPTSIMNHVQGSANRVPDFSDGFAMRALYGSP